MCMKNFDLSCEDAQDKDDWTLRIMGQRLTQIGVIYLENDSIKAVCNYVTMLLLGVCKSVYETVRKKICDFPGPMGSTVANPDVCMKPRESKNCGYRL